MRKPALIERGQAVSKKQVTHVKTIPAPVGGWNARDPLAAMKPLDAVQLENWFPRVADCVVRGGESSHVTGFAALPKSIMLHTPPTGTKRMFASTNAGVFDVTSAGAVGAAVAACTEGYWNWTQMGVSGGHYLLMFNGADNPLYYNGTTWVSVTAVSAPAITGVTTSTLIAAAVYKRRLFLIENGKLSFWYLPVDAVGGAAVEFLLGPLAQKGGQLTAIGNWSFDGGDGPDDYIAFVTSEGEVIVYTGTNPADALAWSLVGVYFVGKPIGRKCFEKYGGDLVLITEFGVFPLSKSLLSASIDYKLALTNKIEGAFNTAARTYGSQQGWEGCLLPLQSAFIFNIPTSANGSTGEQYVMNTTTKAWCKFTGWNASCFEVFNGELYFATGTRIAKAWTGRADNGANISASAKTAYHNFGDRSQEKEWTLFRPLILADGTVAFSIGLSIDFEQNPPLSSATYSSVSGAVWDTAIWDTAFWTAGLEIQSDWRTPGSRPGEWAAAIFNVVTTTVEIQWVANDYVYQVGGVLGG